VRAIPTSQAGVVLGLTTIFKNFLQLIWKLSMSFHFLFPFLLNSWFSEQAMDLLTLSCALSPKDKYVLLLKNIITWVLVIKRRLICHFIFDISFLMFANHQLWRIYQLFKNYAHVCLPMDKPKNTFWLIGCCVLLWLFQFLQP